MAPRKPVPKLALLVPLLVVCLSVPGGAAQQQDLDLLSRVDHDCTFGRLDRKLDKQLLRCALMGKNTIKDCCRTLKSGASGASDCACSVLKVIEGKGIDLNNVCGTTAIAKPCEDKAEAARKAQEREDKLTTTLNPCERFFERFASGDTSKITAEDARGCLQRINTCTASCQKQ